MSVSVYLSVRMHKPISASTRPNFTRFITQVAYGRSSVLLCRHCDTLCTSGFVDDVMLSTLDHGTVTISCLAHSEWYWLRPVLAEAGAKTRRVLRARGAEGNLHTVVRGA